eukprot:TRINITY_DN58284_c0_g1_i1.p1 TRINITY_DN58284_c0_g1~~TRINITY_DN58284_c0_g1_i1.p1  ORF type:complete len:229 (+),score=58.31 TRINITY_DN58284_c0_g1_i1:64-750(+)
MCFFFFFQAEDGIRDAQESRGLGDVYKRQPATYALSGVDVGSLVGGKAKPKPLSAVEIDGRQILRVEMKRKMALRLMKDTVAHWNVYSLKPWLKERYRCDVISMLKIHNTSATLVHCRLVYFPAFIVQYDHHGQTHSAAISGDGERCVMGRHYSVPAMAGISAGAALSAAAILGTMESTLVSGFLSGVLMYSHASNTQFLLHVGSKMNEDYEAAVSYTHLTLPTKRIV